MAAAALAGFACACASGTSGDSASPTSTPSPETSAQSTARARDTLTAFFAAWQAKDVASLEACLPADRQGKQWELEGLDRVEFGKITESPDMVAQYISNGRGYATGVAPEDVRSFQADIAFFYKQGYHGAADEGQPLAWHWFLERDDGGDWKVADFGF